ncbi:hypothetical protein KC330_g4824 [Hortaea werneckii]|nr:hypothetical protein KC330_g4824 [Hortaea werneckii]
MRALQLLSLPSFTLAVSLMDFQPGYPQKKMSSACQRVYTQQLAQCSASDWTQQDACSKECVNYLNELTDDVISACSNQGIEGQNIIVAYLNRDGATSLCGNGKEVLNAGGSGSNTNAQSTSTQPQTTGQTSALSTSKPTLKAATTRPDTTTDTMSTSTTSTRAANSGITESGTTNSVESSTISSVSSTVTQATSIASNSVMTAAPISSSSSSPSSSLGLNFDTSAPPSPASFGPAPTASTSSSSSASGQYENDNSGGGSPFDTQGNVGNAANGIYIPASVAVILVPFAVGWL